MDASECELPPDSSAVPPQNGINTNPFTLLSINDDDVVLDVVVDDKDDDVVEDDVIFVFINPGTRMHS
jgi:hypothetical protein